MMKRVPIARPVLGEAEKRYVKDALDKGDISGFFGEYIERFEQRFAAYCGTKHGVACSSGTAALHLAVAALGLGSGDEILTATLTNMATFFAGLYEGATMVPIDVEPDTLNLDPALLEAKITPRTKAILVVHLFGHPVDMDPVNAVARRHGLAVIEDAAEAHGATYKGRRTGSLGTVGCFSFYANKILTTGEGGMLTTDDPVLAAKARSLRGLAFGEKNKFMHQAVGFNYRMTNPTAALGCGQVERMDEIVAAKRRIAAFYDQAFAGCSDLQLPLERPWAGNVYWMYHVLLQGRFAGRRVEVMASLSKRGIESRECFVPFNQQELFLQQGLTRADACPVANDVAPRGLYLPSGIDLTDEDLSYVAQQLRELLAAA